MFWRAIGMSLSYIEFLIIVIKLIRQLFMKSTHALNKLAIWGKIFFLSFNVTFFIIFASIKTFLHVHKIYTVASIHNAYQYYSLWHYSLEYRICPSMPSFWKYISLVSIRNLIWNRNDDMVFSSPIFSGFYLIWLNKVEGNRVDHFVKLLLYLAWEFRKYFC